MMLIDPAASAFTQAGRTPVDTRSPLPLLDVALPVFNDEGTIEDTVRTLHAHLLHSFPYSFRITVADNASADNTLKIAERLARELPEVAVIRVEDRGRGSALRRVWSSSPSPVLAYVEAGLPADLSALAPLVAPLISGHSGVASGTRWGRSPGAPGSPRRGSTCRSYKALLRLILGERLSDAQCGFKAIRADVAQQLLPHVKDNAWFFDTELLVVAGRSGVRIQEVPVDWTGNPNPGVDVVRTAFADLRSMVRLNRDLATGRVPVAKLRAALARTPLPAISAPKQPSH